MYEPEGQIVWIDKNEIVSEDYALLFFHMSQREHTLQ